jgi:hypothetical protein
MYIFWLSNEGSPQMLYSKVEGARLKDVCIRRDLGHWEVLRESMGAGAVQET